jgi:hypothetical protein
MTRLRSRSPPLSPSPPPPQSQAAAVAALASSLLPSPASAALPPVPLGNVSAVYDLVERLLPGASPHFNFSLVAGCAGGAPGCFSIADGPGGLTSISGLTTSDVSAGLGHYLREVCNLTIGWPRGGGNNLFVPSPWPAVGTPITRPRTTPYTYSSENVCTSSYSLVWYSWDQWSQYIDLQALNGVNLKLSLNGQEVSVWWGKGGAGRDSAGGPDTMHDPQPPG